MFDFHTHRLDTPPGAGIVCLPQDALLHTDAWLSPAADSPVQRLPRAAEGALYAVGIHPWWVAQPDFDLARHLHAVERLAALPEVVQLGECGLDTVQGDGDERAAAPLEAQIEVFRAIVGISESCGKPLTIHCVKTYDQLLRLKKQLRPRQQWTVHGFRGGPALARQLLDAGIDLSFGPRHNVQSYALTPPGRRHDETDAL